MAATTAATYSSSSSSSYRKNRNDDNEVDSHAVLILRSFSPPEACVDSSLGPYVCSILRNSFHELEDKNYPVRLEEIPELESIIELLEEHCSMEYDTAKRALEMIYSCVQTGVIDERHTNRCNNSDHIIQDDYEMINYITEMMNDVDVQKDHIDNLRTEHLIISKTLTGSPTSDPLHYDHGCSNSENLDTNWTPMKPLTLIPTDLLNEMDDDVTSPVSSNNLTEASSPIALQTESNTENEIDVNENMTSKSINPKESGNSIATESKPLTGQDLAASLFCISRSRSNSVPNDKYTTPVAQPSSTSSFSSTSQVSSVVEMLMSTNEEIGEEAACCAAIMSNGDVNVAQYIMYQAMHAPPICRHMLHDGCYRSDCQFSHDIEGSTCLFWLRGRCVKKETCRFLHGFNQKFLEGIQFQSNICPPVSTSNLVQHNDKFGSSTDYSLSNYSQNKWNQMPFEDSSSPFSSSFFSNTSSTPNSDYNMFSMDPRKLYSQGHTTNQPQASSFASVASKGYNQSSSFAEQRDASTTNNATFSNDISTTKYAKIPQDLWNPNTNRNSVLFHIADPIQRFYEVSLLSRSNGRNDVIDLHFQSIKTFPIVLKAILSDRLKICKDGVWVVTGSGHHVNRNSHQKSGGVLEKAVFSWLLEKKYKFLFGRDRNGYGGAILVKTSI